MIAFLVRHEWRVLSASAIARMTIAVFAVAGTIEGFVTGSALPTAARVGIGVAAELAFVAYVGILGPKAAAAT